jgi:hypothetical protein
VTVGVLLIVIALGGFWPQYYGALISDELQPRLNFWVIHVHAALFLGWLCGFVIQALLVQRASVKFHRRFGVILAWYGAAIMIFGVCAGFLLVVQRLHEGWSFDRAAGFLFVPLSDMAMFAGFLTAGILYRSQIDIHKRLMVLTTMSLSQVGMGRLLDNILPMLRENRLLFDTLWFSPIILVIAYDLASKRRIYPVYVIGAVLFLLRKNRDVYFHSEYWLPVGRALLHPFAH